MTITWLGHACFLLESGGYRILLDPFQGVPGLSDVSAEANDVYCSHGHFDHAYTDLVRLIPGDSNPFAVQEIPSFHDDKGGSLRGENIIRKCTAEDLSAVHLGDLGHQLSDEQIAAIGRCDLLFVPVGGIYTVDSTGAKAVVDALQPRVVIPMHFRTDTGGFDNIATVDGFLSHFSAEKICRYDSNVFTLTADSPAQVAVLHT